MELLSVTYYRPEAGDITSEATMKAATFLETVLRGVSTIEVGCATISLHEIDAKFYITSWPDDSAVHIEIGTKTGDKYSHLVDVCLKIGEIFEIRKKTPYTARIVVSRGASDD